MHKVIAAILIGSGLMMGQAAQAQSWGGHFGNGESYEGPYRHFDQDDGLVRSVCSGSRAYALESRLRHEEDEDEIDEDTARRIHWAIDRLEDRQRHECDEGDFRTIKDISYRYNRIGQWIDREAHGGWRTGW
jgi:hypothetical protein